MRGLPEVKKAVAVFMTIPTRRRPWMTRTYAPSVDLFTKALRWLRAGAQPTETVARLLAQSGAMEEFTTGARSSAS